MLPTLTSNAPEPPSKADFSAIEPPPSQDPELWRRLLDCASRIEGDWGGKLESLSLSRLGYHELYHLRSKFSKSHLRGLSITSTRFNVESLQLLCDILRAAPLESLSLHSNTFSDCGDLDTVAEALGTCPNLHFIDLRHCHISEPQLASLLLPLVNSTIRTLWLDGCVLGAAAIPLIDMLGNSKHLKNLSTNNCNLGVPVILGMCEMMLTTRKLPLTYWGLKEAALDNLSTAMLAKVVIAFPDLVIAWDGDQGPDSAWYLSEFSSLASNIGRRSIATLFWGFTAGRIDAQTLKPVDVRHVHADLLRATSASTLDMLLAAGLDLVWLKDPLMVQIALAKSSRVAMSFLSKPQSLKALARAAVRKALGPNKVVAALPLLPFAGIRAIEQFMLYDHDIEVIQG